MEVFTYFDSCFSTRPKELDSKQGSSGVMENFLTNYFRVKTPEHWSLHQYRVDFAPDLDVTKTRKFLLNQHRERLSPFAFDGTMLFSPTELGEAIELLSEDREV
jgi:aubergine-like protein